MRSPKALPRLIASCFAIITGSACASPDAPTAPLLDRASYIETFSVREKAITLSLVDGSDSVRLNITALFGDGSDVTGPFQFTASDSTISVDNSGLVVAKFATTGGLAYVRVSVFNKGLTRRDSVQVRVLGNLPTVLMHNLELRAPDGASTTIPSITPPTLTKPASVGTVALIVQALGIDLTPVPNNEILIALRSSDNTVAGVSQAGLVTAMKPGDTYIVASAFANGTFITDSIAIHIVLPQYVEYVVPLLDVFQSTGLWMLSGDTARIAAGGVVVFDNPTSGGPAVDLIFDKPEFAEAALPGMTYPFPLEPGNILGFRTIPMLPDWSNLIESAFSHMIARKFSTPGVYPFHGVMSDPNIRSQMKGVIIVCPLEERECDP